MGEINMTKIHMTDGSTGYRGICGAGEVGTSAFTPDVECADCLRLIVEDPRRAFADGAELSKRQLGLEKRDARARLFEVQEPPRRLGDEVATATWKITRRSSGAEMGEYEGGTEYAALCAMMADAGHAGEEPDGGPDRWDVHWIVERISEG